MPVYVCFSNHSFANMGGNAICDKRTNKSICGRLTKLYYEKVKVYILRVLQEAGFICETVLELPGKQDFGDIDIIYIARSIMMKNFIQTAFNLEQDWHIVTNGNVMSFAFNCSTILQQEMAFYFQVDLIKVSSPEHLELSRFYLAYSDVGSIIGRIVNYYGLKFGDAGLWCELFEHTVDPESKFDARTTLGKIVLSKNVPEICKYLDLDYEFWKSGIPTLGDNCEAIFAWIVKSKWFNERIFRTLNSEHRSRFAKRKFYEKFAKYIGIEQVEKTGDCIDGETGGMTKNMQMHAITHFRKEREMHELIQDIKRRRERSQKFTGQDLINMYKDICGLDIEGKVVGEKISMIRSTVSLDFGISWDDFLDAHTSEQIKQAVQRIIAKDVANLAI